MKVLYLKGYKWLLFQQQRVRNDFFGQTFFSKKTLKSNDVSVPNICILSGFQQIFKTSAKSISGTDIFPRHLKKYTTYRYFCQFGWYKSL